MLCFQYCIILWIVSPWGVAGYEVFKQLDAFTSQSATDYMGRVEKEKMLWLCEDIMKESYNHMRQITAIRKEHEQFISFHVGIIIGKIREKFRFMTEIYRDILDKKKQRTSLSPPAIHRVRPFHFVVALEMIHYLGVEIDKLIHVLEVTVTPELKTENFVLAIPDIARAGNEDEEIEQKAEEELVKSITRERYLMKKLGRSPNITTTRKRFLHQWPVEDTWSNEAYSQL